MLLITNRPICVYAEYTAAAQEVVYTSRYTIITIIVVVMRMSHDVMMSALKKIRSAAAVHIL